MGGHLNPTRISPRRAIAVLSLFSLVCAATLSVADPPAKAAVLCTDHLSPKGEIAIVNNNLEERDIADMNDTRDMQIFLNRLLDGAGSASGYEIPYTPDVLLLQEVRDKSALTLAGLLQAKTGCRFILAVGPGSYYAKQVGDHVVINETAILLNADTMTKEHDGGHIMTKYRRSQSSPQKRVFKKHAYGLAKEIDSGLTISLASVHFAKDGSLKNLEIAKKKKEDWSRQVARNLKKRYPNADLSSIAGDFNAHRCYGQDHTCEGASFWRALRHDFNYIDSYYAMKDFGHYIDYIWGKKFVVDADEDTKYDHAGADRDPFYSDHQFRWAILAATDVVDPEPFKVLRAEGWGGTNPRIQLRWTESFDGGGLLPYRVLRAPIDAAGDCGTFDVVDLVPTDVLPSYEDKSLRKGQAHCYQIKAVDKTKRNFTLAKIKQPLDESTPGVKIVNPVTVIVSAGT